jgi:hypothetical protein
MNDISAADIAARVVAWHNRHPLARRLRVADVYSVGHVALPFLAPGAAAPEAAAAGGSSLRERAMARARQAPGGATAPAPGTPLQAAFHDDFIPPLSPGEVAVFGARHGIERPREPGDAPVRRVPAQQGSGGLAWRWLLTAELRAGGARTRVLLGPVPGAPVLGRRLWSLPRVGALAALGGAALALVLAMGLLGGAAGPAPGAVLPGAVVQPAPTGGPATAPAASAATSAPASAPAAAIVSAAASAALPAASRPIDVEPRLGTIDLPPIGGIVDRRRQQAAAAAASAALAAASAAPGGAPNAPPAAATAAAPAAAASAPVFALATRLLRTRAESQQIAEALTALLVVPGSPVQRVDVLPAGDDFRVVAWPYAGRTEAQQAQARLLARGHRLQVISF